MSIGFPVEARPVVHEFADEPFDLSVPVYALDEVVVEKLRAFLQTAVNLDRRDWTNRAGTSTTCRGCTRTALRWPGRTCVDRCRQGCGEGWAFTGPADFLDPRVLRSYRGSWNVRLANVVPNLPPFDEALTALLAILGQVFATETPRVSLG